MKLLRVILSMFLLAILSACGGGGGSAGNTSGAALFTTAAKAITISPGETQIYTIGGGVPAYSANSNSSAALVSVNGKTLTITGGGGGSATVTVKDGAGAVVTIDVTVGSGITLYTTAPSAVTVAVGATSSVYQIGGGSQVYAVSSSNSQIATVGVSGNRFVITGVAGGKATVSVKDSIGGAISIDVVVGTSDDLFTTAATDVTLAVGAANTFTVGGGTTTYSASSSNTAAATAKIVGNNLIITGIDIGKATVVVRDTAKGSVTINVTVGGGVVPDLFTTATNPLVVAPSTSPTFTIGGGKAPYSASSSNAAVAAIQVSGNTLTIRGLIVGAAKVAVTDSVGKQIVIDVTVGTGSSLALFTTAPSSITVSIGSTVPYSIGGGVAPYNVTSSNVGVVTVTNSGTDFSVTGVSAGSAQVVITDATGKVISVSVSVASTASAALTASPNGATGSIGDTLVFRLSGGTPGYTVTNNNPNIATVSPTSVASGGSFTAKLLNAGTTAITVTDTQGQVIRFDIVANQGNASLLRMSPSAFSISELYAGKVDLSIYGGTGPYTAYSSDTRSAPVSVSSNVFTVSAVAAGTRCFTPATPLAPYVVTLTVVDSLGASTSSTMNIADNGVCP